MEQRVQFCTTRDGVRIAYAAVGSGPPLVKTANWLNHLEFDWQSPLWRPLLEDLAQDFQLVRYDERGNGLSDRDVADLSFESFVSDLESVIDAAGLERFPLLGISQGGPVSIAYAVRHPERVSHLILYGTYACGWRVRAHPEEVRLREAMLALIEQGWGKENPAFRQIWTSFYIPGGTPEQMEWFNELQRVSASPQNAIRLLSVFGGIDVRPLLQKVTTPTLVLHCHGDAAVPLESGRLIAAGIPGARFVTLPGKNHIPLPQDEAWHLMSAEIRRFLGAPERPPIAPKQASRAAEAPQAAVGIGSQLSYYRLEAELGRGGMGVVYRARDTRLGRDVAVKILPEKFASDPHRLSRFEREARTASALNHPNLVTLYDVGFDGSTHFIVMEYLVGKSLADLLEQGPIPVHEALRLAAQIADGLAKAHAAGIVHRDLKPANIFVTTDGFAKILDFGLAKLVEASDVDADADTVDSARPPSDMKTVAGTVMGTPAYMSPEQAKGLPVTAASDQFSFGSILYEMITGKRPFAGQTDQHTMAAIIYEQPEPIARIAAGIPEELGLIIERCHEKNPAHRYTTQTGRGIRHAEDEIPAPDTRRLARDLEGLRLSFMLDTLRPAPAIEKEDEPVSPPVAPEQPGTSAEPAAPLAGSEATKPSAFPRRFFLARGIAMITLLAVGVLALIPGVWERIFSGKPAVPKIESLAVLPLDNMSGDPAQEYFAAAMTEELTSEMAALRSLRVTSRSSAGQYRDKKIPLTQVAQELGVDALIEGSVFRTGDRVRITVQLIDGKTDKHLWSASYTRSGEDAIRLQREVAQAIASELRLTLTPAEQQHFASAATSNPQAYESYLHAVYRLETPFDSVQNADAAIASAREAVTLDPNFAEAYVALASGCVARVFGWQGGQEFAEMAFVALEKALALKPDLAEAYVVRGGLYFTRLYNFDIPKAVSDYKRAIALNPNLASAHHSLGSEFIHAGLHDRGAAALQSALRLDPHMAAAKFRLARAHWQAGRFREALEVYERHGVVVWEKAIVLAYLGRQQDAWQVVESLNVGPSSSFRRGGRTGEADMAATRALLHALERKTKEARREIDASIKAGKDKDHFHHAAFILAAASAEMGDTHGALRLLKLVAENGMPNYPLVRDNPSMHKLRGQAEFEAFMSALKLRWEQLTANL